MRLTLEPSERMEDALDRAAGAQHIALHDGMHDVANAVWLGLMFIGFCIAVGLVAAAKEGAKHVGNLAPK